jgi:pyrroloquinoline-quinone synthase
MDIQSQLNAIVAKWDLLKNPFYMAWSAGTLPTTALQLYAADYAKFISLLPTGWETLADAETAEEEREHAELWEEFAQSIVADVGANVQLPQTTTLMTTAKKLFAQPLTAMGAMYAFEVQQPATATSKLAGLHKHYAALAANERYFEEHTHNQHEAAKLLKMIAALPAADREVALAACKEMSCVLWETLAAMAPEMAMNTATMEV